MEEDIGFPIKISLYPLKQGCFLEERYLGNVRGT